MIKNHKNSEFIENLHCVFVGNLKYYFMFEVMDGGDLFYHL